MSEARQIRHRVDPGDVPAAVAGRRMGLSEVRFLAVLPELLARGFPPADPTTGLFDLDAIDEWRRRRHPRLFLTHPERARDARAVMPIAGGQHGGQRENSLLSRQTR